LHADGKENKASKPEDAAASDDQKPGDESLKGVDPRLVELIENEIVSDCANVTWEDISTYLSVRTCCASANVTVRLTITLAPPTVGLHGAKKALKEMVILPMERPDLFGGLCEPARGTHTPIVLALVLGGEILQSHRTPRVR
jgi:spastin